MAGSGRVGDLEIEQDQGFQRRQWRFERIGWSIMLLVALVALLGGFGRGPIADATVGDGPLRVGYARIDRVHAPGVLRISLGPEATGADQVLIWIESAYLDEVEIVGISPEPSEMRVGSERTVWAFTVEKPGQPVEITVDVEHQRPWRREAHLGVVDGPEVDFGQFIFP